MIIKARFSHWLETRLGWVVRKHVYADILGREFQVIQGAIRENEDYDDAWLIVLAREANIVFDIGCNVGQSSLLLLRADNIMQILLVDPNPTALAQAAENIFRNGLSSKAFFRCSFVSNAVGSEIEFHTIGVGSAGSMYDSMAKTASTVKSSLHTLTTTIDELVVDTGMIPDLIKIDVEGAERLVLAGASRIAKLQTTRFIVELHAIREMPMLDNAQEILQWCETNNYDPYYLKEKKLLTNPNEIAHRGRCHLLLIPGGHPFPHLLKSVPQSAPLSTLKYLFQPVQN